MYMYTAYIYIFFLYIYIYTLCYICIYLIRKVFQNCNQNLLVENEFRRESIDQRLLLQIPLELLMAAAASKVNRSVAKALVLSKDWLSASLAVLDNHHLRLRRVPLQLSLRKLSRFGYCWSDLNRTRGRFGHRDGLHKAPLVCRLIAPTTQELATKTTTK